MVRGRIADLASAIRTGEASASTIVAAAIDRAEQSQPVINAFIAIDHDGAMERAAMIDRRVEEGEDPGPLAGVPVGLKDLIDQEGLPTTKGAAFDPIIPDRSASVVHRLEDAGAVIIGRTGLEEFAYGFTSENEHFGPVRNPWDTELSPGGSSGGSAAAVAAGIVPMAVGTDTGGSVRVPAALCGVMGLKVTHGRIPLDGVYPLAPSLDTVGPLATSVADLDVSYRVMAGDENAAAARSLPSLRIAVVEQWLRGPLSEEVATAFGAFLEHVEKSGAAVERIDDPSLEIPAFLAEGAYVEIAGIHRDRWERDRDRYGRNVAARLELAFAVQPEARPMAETWAHTVGTTLKRIFDRCDVVATPTVGATAKTIGVDTMEVAGTVYQHRVPLATWTAPINRLGLPAMALPLPSSGVPPPSLQLVGGANHEHDLLGVGAALETAGLVSISRPWIWFG